MYNNNNLKKLRGKYIGPSLSLSYNEPLHIVKGYGQYLYDKNGVQYLDAVNNIQHVGHCHPKVIDAAISQYKKLNTNTRYLDETILDYSKALSKKLPKNLNVFFFTNSGSESNDLALRLARKYTKNKNTLVLDGAYHGHLISLIEVSPYKYNGKGGDGCPEYVHEIPRPDSFRGIYRGPNSTKHYLRDFEKTILSLKNKGIKSPTFISEAIMGCGGQLIPPEGFLKKANELIQNDNGLCISDEIQIGFGRLGSSFWGFEHQNLKPDIVTLGKSIGNGHPLSAVVTTKKIADQFNDGMEYFNSFGGNPVSCAIGNAVLEIIEEEGLQMNAAKVGSILKSMLLDLKAKHSSIIGDVRGDGLFLGIEFVKDNSNLEPLAKEADIIVNKMKQGNILLSIDGPNHNVIKIKPPMVFNNENAHQLIEKMNSALLNI